MGDGWEEGALDEAWWMDADEQPGLGASGSQLVRGRALPGEGGSGAQRAGGFGRLGICFSQVTMCRGKWE